MEPGGRWQTPSLGGKTRSGARRGCSLLGGVGVPVENAGFAAVPPWGGFLKGKTCFCGRAGLCRSRGHPGAPRPKGMQPVLGWSRLPSGSPWTGHPAAGAGREGSRALWGARRGLSPQCLGWDSLVMTLTLV